jgi:hypothetical protein
MPGLTSRSLTRVRSVTVFLAAIIALIVSSNIVVTSRGSINRAIMQQPDGVQPVNKVDDRVMGATSKFAFRLYAQLLKQRSSKNIFLPHLA